MPIKHFVYFLSPYKYHLYINLSSFEEIVAALNYVLPSINPCIIYFARISLFSNVIDP